jgi:hypothetical protein
MQKGYYTGSTKYNAVGYFYYKKIKNPPGPRGGKNPWMGIGRDWYQFN